MSSLGVFVTILTIALSMGTIAPDQAEATRAFFVFGDSLVDNGNNNSNHCTSQLAALRHRLSDPLTDWPLLQWPQPP
jgi:hypothetical protein